MNWEALHLQAKKKRQGEEFVEYPREMCKKIDEEGEAFLTNPHQHRESNLKFFRSFFPEVQMK
jgi:hypothetical protein